MTLFGNINQGLEQFRSTPGAMLIDVREAEEFAAGHIPGAVNVPLSTMSDIELPMDAPLFLYCLRGSRSVSAAVILKRRGYSRVKSIGGIDDYRGEIED